MTGFWRPCAKALAAGTLALIARPALAEVDDVVRQAITLERGGKAAEAYALLSPLTETRAGDPDFDYALGIAAADSKRPAEAIAAFQRVLAVQPGNGPARAEIARAYALAGDIDTARAEFNTVVNDPTVPDPVRQRVGRLVRDYDRQIDGGATALTGFLDAEGGYDSNVNSATAATSITLPLLAFLGPATLSGGATRTGEAYGSVQGGLSARLGLSRQTQLYVSALGLVRDNRESRAFDQAAITGTAGITHSLANQDVLSLSGQVQRFWLGGNGYRTTLGAIGQYTHRLQGGRAVSGQVQYYRLDYDKDPARDAHRIAATINYADAVWFAGLGAGREFTVRKTARELGNWFIAGQAGAEVPLSKTFALLAGASVEHRDYRATDPLFLKGRRDTQLDFSLGLRAVIAKGVSLRPRVTYTRNFSNIGLYDYSRVTASIGLRGEF